MQNFSIEVFYLEAEEVKDYRAIKISEKKELREGSCSPWDDSRKLVCLKQIMINLVKNAMKFVNNSGTA